MALTCGKLSVDEGCALQARFRWLPGNVPMVWTGWHAELRAASSRAADATGWVLASDGNGITLGEGGYVDVFVPWGDFEIELSAPKVGQYDLDLIDPDGNRMRFRKGDFVVDAKAKVPSS